MTTDAAAASAHEGPPWPSDHPGRKCALCQLTIYSLWVESAPPPGTCPHKAETASVCPRNVETSINGMGFALHTNSRIDEMRLILIARGLDPAWIEQLARDRLAIDKDGLLQFEPAGIKVRGVELAHWLGQQPDKALVRAAQVMKAIAWHLQFGLEDLTPDARDAWCDRFRRAMRDVTRELLEGPIDDGEVDEADTAAEGGEGR